MALLFKHGSQVVRHGRLRLGQQVQSILHLSVHPVRLGLRLVGLHLLVICLVLFAAIDCLVLVLLFWCTSSIFGYVFMLTEQSSELQ